MKFGFRWDYVVSRWEFLASGLGITLFVATVSMVLALVLGLPIALMRMSRFKLLSFPAQLYINIFRAIPLFVFLIWLYYGFPIILGFNFGPMTAGVMCLTIQYSCWMAEIYRSGVSAINAGQSEAAASLGLTSYQVLWHIIFPQAVRIIIPPAANMFVGMLKDSSLVGIIGVFELVRQTQLAVSQTFRPFEFYTAIAAIYIVLTMLLSRMADRLEQRLEYHG